MLKKLFKVDEKINLGYDVIVKMLKQQSVSSDSRILDVGCDEGQLLKKIQHELKISKTAELQGLDIRECKDNDIDIKALDFEEEQFPYKAKSFDIIICNQVLEHLRSYMWTLSEIIRVTRIGGFIVLGVPNLASAHNRLLLLLGKQPSSIYLTGPHVRGFTPKATKDLLEYGNAMTVVDFRGANYYPFPPSIATKLADLFPYSAVGSFFLVRKDRDIDFLRVWKEQKLATSFYLGD